MPQYKKEHTEVIRRFRDFAWLWQRLQDTNRGLRLAADCMHLLLAPAAIPAQIVKLFTTWACSAGIIVPPLPEKSAVQKFQMTSEFIEQRRRALQVFVNRVVMTATFPALHIYKAMSEASSPCLNVHHTHLGITVYHVVCGASCAAGCNSILI